MLEHILKDAPVYRQLKDEVEDYCGPVLVSGCTDTAKWHLTSLIGNHKKKQFKIIIVPDENKARQWVEASHFFGEKVQYIPAKDPLFYTADVHGNAIEVRINAEDTEHDFRPSPGTVTNVHFPGGKGVRIDSALFAGYKIPPYYDSMIAKLIVYDKNRELALRKLRNALGELVLEGVKTNIDYQYEIINDEDFIEGNVDTGFIERFQKKHQSENEAE